MDDNISRQIAQKLFGKALTYQEQQGKLTWTTAEVKQWVADFIEDLPAAQPAQHIDADGTLWITVTDIEQVKRVIVDEDKSKFCRQFYMDAKPEQRTGYWIPVGVAEVVGGESAQCGSAIAYHKCSVCNEQALIDDFDQEVLSKWCPHCGAKMEGVSE